MMQSPGMQPYNSGILIATICWCLWVNNKEKVELKETGTEWKWNGKESVNWNNQKKMLDESYNVIIRVLDMLTVVLEWLLY